MKTITMAAPLLCVMVLAGCMQDGTHNAASATEQANALATDAPAGPEPAAVPVPAHASDAAVTPASGPDVPQVPVSPAGNASFAGVEMLYPHAGCSFEASPVNFCDDHHRAQIDKAIQSEPANFNGHYVVAQLQQRAEYFQRSIVVIDSRTGRVYPLPIDAFSGPLVHAGSATAYGTLDTALDHDQFCLDGALLVYRAFEEGRFCFGFDGTRFTGHQTAYMASAEG